MKFNENIDLNPYLDEAGKQFEEASDKLSAIDEAFNSRMKGVNASSVWTGPLITALWGVALAVGLYLLRYKIPSWLFTISLFCTLALIVAMLLDNVNSIRYYKVLRPFRKTVDNLRSTVSDNQSSMYTNKSCFMDADKSGWDMNLDAACSVPELADMLKNDVQGMEERKSGSLNKAKTFFFFITAVTVTLAFCIGLFQTAESISAVILETADLDYSIARVVTIVAVVLTMVGELFGARWLWSKTDCQVQGKTLLALPAAVPAHLLITIILSLIILLVMAAIYIVVCLMTVALIGASICGG